ncbi:hypothetical protein AVEN_150005-1 [Araneus ventricosus]|uniref:Uncharacterized protein n=1 Tax=Araneus ventricosus TaxID=182803 RepID=A0A4Y2HRW3_ARAVE|nr:hypothetical protein AVEN_150005-1 [Araneus ventricosus]
MGLSESSDMPSCVFIASGGLVVRSRLRGWEGFQVRNPIPVNIRHEESYGSRGFILFLESVSGGFPAVACSFPFWAEGANITILNEHLPTRNGFLLRQPVSMATAVN